jgi:hypothetical protein
MGLDYLTTAVAEFLLSSSHSEFPQRRISSDSAVMLRHRTINRGQHH